MAEKDIILRINAVTNQDVVEAFGETLDKVLGGSYDELIKKLEENKAAIDGINKSVKEGKMDADVAAKSLRQLKTENANYQRVLNNTDKITKSVNGSQKQQQLILEKVNMAIRNMTAEQKKANPELIKFQKALYDSVKGMNAEMGNFQMNVGNYPQLVQQILPVQGQFSSQLMQMAQSAGLSTGALGALGGALGVGALAYKGFKEAMDLTQTVGDEVAIKVAGLEAVWDKFIRTIVSGDFSNFVQGLRDAKQAGEELAASLDELFERNNALSIEEARLSRQQEENLRIMRDQTKSIKERKEAGEAYIQTEEELAKRREDIAIQEYEALRANFAAQSELSEQEVELVISQYEKYRDAVKAGEFLDIKKDYDYMREALDLTGVSSLTTEQQKALTDKYNTFKALYEGLSEEELHYLDLYRKYNNLNDAETSRLVKAWTKKDRTIANSMATTRKAATTVSGLLKQEQTLEAKAEAKAAKALEKEAKAVGPLEKALKELDDLVEAAENEVLPRLQQVEMPEDKRSPFAKWLGVTPEEFESLKSQALSAAQSIYSSIQQLSQQATQQRLEDELEAVDKEAESEKAILKSKLDKNLISQKQYEKKLAEVDKAAEERREEANREAFKKNKAWNIGQALMNMALAITNIWATNKGGAAARIAETVLASATGLAQIGVIAAQKYARGGELHGASHAQGGIKGNVQGHNIELEGDEVVINKRSARKYRNALSWINSDNGWGVDFAGVRGSGGYTPQLKFARGGVLNSFDFSPSATPTSSSVQQAITKQANRVEELIMATNRRIDRLQVQVNISDIESASDTKQVHVSRATL